MTDISNSTWSVTDTNNTAASPNGWPTGLLANQVRPVAQQMMGATKRWWERLGPAISTTGSAGAYVYTPTNVSYPTAYVTGDVYVAKANFTSVGSDTLNVNVLGAKPIYKPSASGVVAIAAGDIVSGQVAVLAYDAALNGGLGGFHYVNFSSALPTMTNGQLLVGQTGASALAKTVSGAITLDQTGLSTLNPVANSSLATMATKTLKGNNTTGTGLPLDLTVSQVQNMLSIALPTINTIQGTAWINFGGLYIQMGHIAGNYPAFSSATGALGISFPTPFPNVCLGVVTQWMQASGSSGSIVSVQGAPSTTSFNIITQNVATAGDVYWFAWGR